MNIFQALDNKIFHIASPYHGQGFGGLVTEIVLKDGIHIPVNFEFGSDGNSGDAHIDNKRSVELHPFLDQIEEFKIRGMYEVHNYNGRYSPEGYPIRYYGAAYIKEWFGEPGKSGWIDINVDMQETVGIV